MRYSTATLAIAALMAGLGTGPAHAARFHPNVAVFQAAVSLACALDYSNSQETRMIVTNNSGGTLSRGRKLSWTAMGGGTQGAFYLKADFPAGQVLSFGLNAKGYDCTVVVARPESVLAQ